MTGFISRGFLGVAVALLPVFVGWFAAPSPAAAAAFVQRAHLSSVSSYTVEASHEFQGVRLLEANPLHPGFHFPLQNGSQVVFASFDESLGELKAVRLDVASTILLTAVINAGGFLVGDRSEVTAAALGIATAGIDGWGFDYSLRSTPLVEAIGCSRVVELQGWDGTGPGCEDWGFARLDFIATDSIELTDPFYASPIEYFKSSRGPEVIFEQYLISDIDPLAGPDGEPPLCWATIFRGCLASTSAVWGEVGLGSEFAPGILTLTYEYDERRKPVSEPATLLLLMLGVLVLGRRRCRPVARP